MVMKGIVTVGKLEELAHPIQRYLMPLQSIEQFLWGVVCVIVSVALLFAFDVLFEGGTTSIRGWIMTVIASFAASLPAWVPFLPERFVISTSNSSQKLAVVRFLKDTAYQHGYQDVSPFPDGIVLSLVRKRRISKWLGWTTAKQSRLRIAQIGMSVSVTGPGNAVQYLRKVAMKEFGVAGSPGFSESAK